MFTYPHIDPVILHIAGPISIRWYGVAYLLGFLAAYCLGCRRLKQTGSIRKAEFVDCIYWTMLGILIGGRMGYMLLYAFEIVRHDPLQILYIWQGGMSFHGGLVGGLCAIYWFSWQHDYPFLLLTDLIAPLIPMGLFFGRAANFINGELWGRVTDVSWAMVFPHVDTLPRHPSQLYEMFGEGVVLFVIMQCCVRRVQSRGLLSGIFLCCYGSIRFGLECFREPDIQLGFLWREWLTMGQVLCVPMLVAGMVLIYRNRQVHNDVALAKRANALPLSR